MTIKAKTTQTTQTAARASGVRTPKQRAGDAAEEAACQHLERNGCRVVARNVRFRVGELDIVAEDNDTLVFVEVRMRGRADYGGAAASIDFFKRRRLLRAAQQFLAQRFGGAPTLSGMVSGRVRADESQVAAPRLSAAARAARRGLPPCRFDVITADAAGVQEWIRDAFGMD